MRILSCLLIGSALSFGCASSPQAPSGRLPLTTTLQVGQQVTVSGFTARFVGITNDSRCPIDANCIVAGDATLRFDLSANQRTAPYDIQVEAQARRRAAHEGFFIEVQSLTPYPAGTRSIPQDEYRVTVQIGR
ncbi:MAG: hypothetical protein ABI818_12690 [Acidobacteriota bacterium]